VIGNLFDLTNKKNACKRIENYELEIYKNKKKYELERIRVNETSLYFTLVIEIIR
jgi:hypothetical protein